MSQTVNLYTSAQASAEVQAAAHRLRTAGGCRVVVRPLDEMPRPEDGRHRRRYFLEDEPEPVAVQAPGQEGGPQL